MKTILIKKVLFPLTYQDIMRGKTRHVFLQFRADKDACIRFFKGTTDGSFIDFKLVNCEFFMGWYKYTLKTHNDIIDAYKHHYIDASSGLLIHTDTNEFTDLVRTKRTALEVIKHIEGAQLIN